MLLTNLLFTHSLEFLLFLGIILLLIVNYFTSLSKLKAFPNIFISNTFFCCLILFFSFSLGLLNCMSQLTSLTLMSDHLINNVLDVFFCFFSIFIFLFSYPYNYFKGYVTFEFHFFILCSILFFVLLIQSTHFIVVFLILECIAFCGIALSSYDRWSPRSIEAGIKYYFTSCFSSIIFLFGIAFIYILFGVLSFDPNEISMIFQILKELNNSIFSTFSIISIFILFLGFAAKMYIPPLHLWVADIYEDSPNSSVLFFSTIPSIASLYFFIILYNNILFPLVPINNLIYYFIFLSFICILFGTFTAITQSNFKRLIAFSSISNMGYFLLSHLSFNFITSLFGILLFSFYIINVLLLFSIFLNINKGRNFIFNLSDLKGYFTYGNNKTKFLMIFVMFSLFSISGLPPLAFFFIKISIFSFFIELQNYFILFFMLLSSCLSTFYYLKIIKTLFFDEIQIHSFNSSNYHFDFPFDNKSLIALFYFVFFILSFFIFSSLLEFPFYYI